MKRPEVLASLRAVLEKNIAAIEQLHIEALTLVGDWEKQSKTFTGRAGLGFVLHNIYNALEGCFDQISRTCENHVVDNTKWHSELLGKMFLDISGVRPKIFSASLREFLEELRGFRHVFRHSYEYQLNPVKLKALADSWIASNGQILSELSCFVDRMQEELRG